ncbi:unnamed protein product [Psylliodes chrysocephalus]|uniref:Transmembrane protein n=1 Tax=Psylliodes chrysocephalus TaxID=3402493 RepID=A0A9P0GNC1_9CUCU|nr:unnamed protein product [Psylliodes chrysocephala]
MHFGGRLHFFLTKWVCCSLINLTVACRLIAFAGITISLWLTIAFASDKFWTKDANFDVSRKTALALGLDWQHLHKNTSLKLQDDPDGKMIAIVVAFYSFLVLGINLLLFVATIRYDWCFSLPWLIVEMLSCVSKFGALIFHWNCDFQDLQWGFFVGSIIYIVLYTWWWLVVFSAQHTWRNQQQFDLEGFDREMLTLQSSTRVEEGFLTPPKMHVYRGSCTDISAMCKAQGQTQI